MADAMDFGNNLRARAFLLLKMLENSAKRRRRRKRMQTVLAYFAARRRQMITVCALSLLLVMHHRVVATRQYNRKNIRCHHRLVWPAKPPLFSCNTLLCACSRVKPVEKYIKIIYAFGLAQLKYGVWIKAGLQPFFPAEPGGINWLSRSRWNQPFRIDSDAVPHMNLVGHFTVVYLLAKPLIWSEAEGDHVVIETSISLAW